MSGNNEEQQINKKQNQSSDSSKEATKTAAKAAANAYAGPLGGKAVDLASKTEIGNKILERGAKQIDRNPALRAMAKNAQQSGALNAANQVMDSSTGGSGQAPASSGSAPKSSMSLGPSGSKSGGSSFFNNGKNKDNASTTGDVEGEVDATTKLTEIVKKNKLMIVVCIVGILILFFPIIIVVISIISPALGVIDFFERGLDAIESFINGKTEEEWELEYYNTLKEVQEKLNTEYSVCIDVNLITATLTVNKANDQYLEEGQTEEDASGSELGKADYKRMIKQVELLGNMQIKRKIYGLDERVKASNSGSGIADDYCRDETSDYPVSNDDDIANFKYSKSFLSNLYATLSQSDIPARISTTTRDIARNDIEAGFLTFFQKKANQEKNIEYRLYVPAYTKVTKKDAQGNPLKDEDGNIIYEKVCNAEVPISPLGNDYAQLDIGSLNDMENNVYYWNLMENFIVEYYQDYLPNVSFPIEEGSEDYEKVKDIIENIYLLYNEMGPNQSCETSSYICRDDEGSDYYGGGETSLERSEFIERIAPTAIDEMTRTGVFASVTIAQAALESGNGSSGLSSKYSNYYGMTAGGCAPDGDPSGFKGKVLATGEGGNECTGNAFWNGSVVAMCNSSGKDCQWYRVYDSFLNSTKDHSRLVSESYGCNAATYEAQLNCIVSHGYASDSSYKKKIMNIIADYDLTQYDIGTWDGSINPVTDPEYNDQICAPGTATGDWANWKQYDPAWKNVPLGPSTVGAIGCAMTSISIQIMRSGVSTTLGANFNPGTFAQELTRIGGFDSRGNIYWAKVTEIAPGFNFVRRGNTKSVNEIASYVNQGYYVILNVKNGKHWVAVDRVEGNKIYMFDPGSGGTEVGQTYGLESIVGYALYKRG